ncbi:MAG: hypothetical protein HZB38_02790 [Planctomycetes bacterium]|nr:hypothetical protein [Planctomycetota bacterium]
MDAGSLGACNQDGTWFAITSWDGQAHVAARWSASTGFQSIGELPGGETYSMPYAISDDGNVIVGVSWSGTAFEEAFRWTPETGIVGLGSTLGGTESKALGTAMLLQDYALDLSDAVLWEVRAISRDGRNIAGVGRERWSGPVKMWLVHMEPCCTPADLNCDLRVDISDLALLLSHFGSCAADAGFWPRADIDRRGCVDLPDLAALLSSFGSDCR